MSPAAAQIEPAPPQPAPAQGAPRSESAAFLRVEPRLVEEATFLFLRGHPDLRRFDSERTRIYAIEDPEDRERRFRDLHAAWFLRLGLDQPLRQALKEQPSIGATARVCLVARAVSPRDEGADLHVGAAGGGGAGGRTVILRLRPEAFGLPARLLGFLRLELLHVADILDPSFGYEPELPEAGPDPARQRIILDRYASLWDASVGGRLARAGRGAADAREARKRQFERAFATLAERGEALFERLWAGGRPPHAALLAIARDPEGAARRMGAHGVETEASP